MELVLVALALVAGVSPVRIGLLALALLFPWGFAVLLLVAFAAGRRGDAGRTTPFLEGVAAELRAGSTLRQAVAASAAAAGEPGLAVAALESGFTEVGVRAAERFPGTGRELEVALMAAAESGSGAADLFDELASVAMAREEIRREVAVASAPGRVAAGIFVGAPLLWLGQRWAAGGLAAAFATSAQRVAATLGIVLFLAGLAGALVVLWRAR